MVGKCNYYWKFECGLTLEQSCDCGNYYQTMEQITSQCYMQMFRECKLCSDNRFTVFIFQHNYFVLVIKSVLSLNVDNVNSSIAISFFLENSEKCYNIKLKQSFQLCLGRYKFDLLSLLCSPL